jgi:NCS1 family nucleobase:cation symporter-1
MNHVRRFGAGVVQSLKIQDTDGNLTNKNSGRVWSNRDLDPVAPERRNWNAWTFGAYWVAEAWAPNTWAVGASLVAGGLLWWHALLACIVGHLIASGLTVWNGRAGAVYHIGVCASDPKIPCSY